MTVIELNRTAVEEVGPTEPILKIGFAIFVFDENREVVFKRVAKATASFTEITRTWISGRGSTLIHSVTGKPLTEEWLFEYLAKIIDFRYPPPENEPENEEDDDERPNKVSGPVPEWLPRMMLKRADDFNSAMQAIRWKLVR